MIFEFVYTSESAAIMMERKRKTNRNKPVFEIDAKRSQYYETP